MADAPAAVGAKPAAPPATPAGNAPVGGTPPAATGGDGEGLAGLLGGGEAAPPATPPPPAAPPAATGAPEKYDFKHPDAANGAKYDDASIGAFSEIAKGSGWTQEQAQKHLDQLTKVGRERAQAVVTELRTKWDTEAAEARTTAIKQARDKFTAAAKADAELGGAKFDESTGIAKAALETVFGTDDAGKKATSELLEAFGLAGNEKSIGLPVLRFLVKVGKAIGGDKFRGNGTTSAPSGEKTAKQFYQAMGTPKGVVR